MKKLCKGTLVVLLAFMLMFTTIVPTLAANSQEPDISDWAVGALNEGERYGIFPMEWYFDGFREEVTRERLDALLTLTDARVADLGLEKNQDFTPIPLNNDSTRGDIIKRLYNIVGQYDLPVGDSALTYMQERGIIKGTNQGLELENVATTEQAVIFAIRFLQDTYYQVDAGAKGFAWKVQNNGNTVYLLGSIHVGSTDLYPFNQQLLNAFNQSDALFVEVNPFDMAGLQYFLTNMYFDDGTTIDQVLSDETYENLLQVLEMYEIPVEAVASVKPWAIANDLSTISLGESFEVSSEQMASLGMDMYFLTKSLLDQKPIIELEGYINQTNLFNGLSTEGQNQYLASVLYSILEGNSEAVHIEQWFKDIVNGDVEHFTKNYNSLMTETTEFEEMLFGVRDKNMAEKISEILESEEQGTYFVVVGAGHFVVNESILFHLEEAGYKVEGFYE